MSACGSDEESDGLFFAETFLSRGYCSPTIFSFVFLRIVFNASALALEVGRSRLASAIS